jgi:N,N'-diacetyllegionaminate synthase
MRLSLGDRALGPGAPALLVAEIGSNHDGSLERALALVDAAAGAGADAVQFHSLRAARLLAPRARRADGAWVAAEGHGHLERVELRTEWHATLRDRASARGLVFLSTPFDEQRAELLAALGVCAFPVAAGDLVHVPLLRALGGFGRPILLATALAAKGEIDAALAAIGEGAGPVGRRPPVVLLAGPREPDGTSDLRAIDALATRHATLAGWSDRRPGHVLAVGAVARGAAIVVKPFSDDPRRRGPGHADALDPSGFRAMTDAVRELEAALRDEPVPARVNGTARKASVRGIYAARALPAGTVLEAADLKLVRPALGAAPSALAALVGRRLLHALAPDEPIDLGDVA